MLRNFNVEPEALSELFTSSAVVESSEEKKEKSETAEMEAPSGFDKMAKVPAGSFLYGGDKTPEETKTPFEIDIYPVTNGGMTLTQKSATQRHPG